MNFKSFREIGGALLGVLLVFLVYFSIRLVFDYFGDPLTKAVKEGDVTLVESLLKSGSDVNPGNSLKPLHIASEYGPKQIVVLLLESGADINARTKFDATPLHFAAQGGDTSIVNLLISKGAQLNAEDDEGITPLGWIIGRDWSSRQMIDLLALYEKAQFIKNWVKNDVLYIQMVEKLRTDSGFRESTKKRLKKNDVEFEEFMDQLKNFK